MTEWTRDWEDVGSNLSSDSNTMSLRPSLHPFSFMPRVKNNNNTWFCVLQSCAIKYFTAVKQKTKEKKTTTTKTTITRTTKTVSGQTSVDISWTFCIYYDGYIPSPCFPDKQQKEFPMWEERKNLIREKKYRKERKVYWTRPSAHVKQGGGG